MWIQNSLRIFSVWAAMEIGYRNVCSFEKLSLNRKCFKSMGRWSLCGGELMKLCMHCISAILCLYFILMVHYTFLPFFVLDTYKYLKGHLIRLLVGPGPDIFCTVLPKVRSGIPLSSPTTGWHEKLSDFYNL